MPTRERATQVSSVLTPGRVRPRPLFLHFFDVHFLEERGAVARSRDAFVEMDLAKRFAVMVGSRVLLPASSYYESDVAVRVLRPFLDSAHASQRFSLVGSGASIEEFSFEKRPQYPAGSPQHTAYLAAIDSPMGWWRRKRSAGRDIATGWRSGVPHALRAFHGLYREGTSEAVFERQWLEVEEKLGPTAWIVPHVIPLLDVDPRNILIRNRLHDIINGRYFESYSKDPGAGMIQGLRKLSYSHGLPSQRPEDDLQFDFLEKGCRDTGIHKHIVEADPDDLDRLSTDERFVAAFQNTQTEGFARMTVPKKMQVDLAIVTALDIEREAVEFVFGRGVDRISPEDKHMYRVAALNIRDEPFNVVYAASGQGNVAAGVLASNMLRSFDVRYVAFVGIAGGCPKPDAPEDHVRLGDIVVSTAVVEHDHYKLLQDGKVQRRGSPQAASLTWLQTANSLKNNRFGFSDDWHGHYAQAMKGLGGTEPDPALDVLHDYEGNVLAHPDDVRREGGRAIVHTGVVAAGDTLLKDPVVRDAIRDMFAAKAIEMEAAGLWGAAYHANKEFIVVRGIVDYCDSFKADNYRTKSSASAAAVLRLLYETLKKAQIEGGGR